MDRALDDQNLSNLLEELKPKLLYMAVTLAMCIVRWTLLAQALTRIRVESFWKSSAEYILTASIAFSIFCASRDGSQ